MATSFPSSLDSFTNPLSSDTLSSPSHSAQHADANDAIEALQAKVGADSSAVTSSLDYRIAQLESDVAGFTSGKILQVVRATDTTTRSTTSTSYIDANTITITPTSATSTILLLWTGYLSNSGGSGYAYVTITDSSNVEIESAQSNPLGVNAATNYQALAFFGYDSPATTSATTYKARFRASASNNTVVLHNAVRTGQMIALEIGA